MRLLLPLSADVVGWSAGVELATGEDTGLDSVGEAMGDGSLVGTAPSLSSIPAKDAEQISDVSKCLERGELLKYNPRFVRQLTYHPHFHPQHLR